MQTRDRISLQEPDRSWVLWGQTQAGAATVGPSSAVPFKIKDGLTVQPSGGSPGHTFQRRAIFAEKPAHGCLQRRDSEQPPTRGGPGALRGELAEKLARRRRGNDKAPAAAPPDTWVSVEEVVLLVGTHAEFVR